MRSNKIFCWWQKDSYKKKADKGSAVVIWDRDGYINEDQKQLGDENIYGKVNFKKKLLSELVDKSNSFLKSLKEKDVFRIKLWNILLTSIRKLLIWGNFTCFLTYTSVYTMFQEDLSFLTEEHLLKKLQSFFIFIWKGLCKKILMILWTWLRMLVFLVMLC